MNPHLPLSQGKQAAKQVQPKEEATKSFLFSLDKPGNPLYDTCMSNFPTGLDTKDFPEQDRRNVIDHYKYWDEDAIRAHLDERRHPLAILCENYAHDFNLASTIRAANAFLAKEVIIAGRRRWDKRGAVGVNHYEHIRHVEQSVPVLDEYRQQGYRVVAVDNVPGAVSVFDYQWDPNTIMVFGQESIGLSPAALEAADDVVYIPQYGSTRSLNVAVAGGIMMAMYMQSMEQQGLASPDTDHIVA